MFCFSMGINGKDDVITLRIQQESKIMSLAVHWYRDCSCLPRTVGMKLASNVL